ncbi:MAG TPA: alkaline phosphatase family protein [Candidatus Nitrosotalea sp.]|nr:alkaline phosphatase family protein [Candidatus Nitrosotalea sp.]
MIAAALLLAASLSSIKHIVIVVQENRSFDNLFEGYPSAHTSPDGKLPGGGRVKLQAISMKEPYDISHAYQDARTAYDRGAMDGFAYEYTGAGGSQYAHPQYGFVPRSEIRPYWEIAQKYVLADNMFASQLDGSYVAHQYLIAGWAGNAYNYPAVEPWGCDAAAGNAVGLLDDAGHPDGITAPCFGYPTIAGELDAHHISWRYYAPQNGVGYSWTAFDAIARIRRGPDWAKDIVHPETRILSDVARGNLAAVTWVVPSLPLSDHAGSKSDRGPSWVSSIVNAIGKSSLWSSTAIFVTWDDWGGWYDDVTPPQLDRDGLGFRVPLMCVSPYAKTGYVDHTQYEFGSLLKLVETRFNLPSLHKTDERASAPLNCFNFQQAPRPFRTLSQTYSTDDITLSASDSAPDGE